MVSFILMDIEGTTTAIDFVHQTLFPYARAHMVEYLEQHGDELSVASCLTKVADTLRAEGTNPDPDQAAIIAALIQWIDEDRKHPALKKLQGQIWERGYREGHYVGHLYKDVKPSWEAWRSSGKQLGIYSSGSVQAQKLLFGHTAYGDLNGLISYYFDTGMGHKREVASYRNIVAAVSQKPEDLMFLSDIPEELDAAKKAGLQTIHVVRPGTEPCSRHPNVSSFREIKF